MTNYIDSIIFSGKMEAKRQWQYMLRKNNNRQTRLLCLVKVLFKMRLGLPVVHWLRFNVSTAGGTGSIPAQGTKIPHAMQGSQKLFLKIK